MKGKKETARTRKLNKKTVKAQKPIAVEGEQVAAKVKCKRISTAAIREQQNESLISGMTFQQLKTTLWTVVKSKRINLREMINNGIVDPDSTTVPSMIIRENQDTIPNGVPDPNGVNISISTCTLSKAVNAIDIPNPDDPPSNPSNDDLPHWCRCRKCVAMPTADEKRCCYSPGNIGCITENAQFPVAILDRDVLQIQMQLRLNMNAYPYDDENKCYRHAAYRQYVCWRYGCLGPGNRRVIPSCVVTRIRREYPKPNNARYTGFIPHRPLV